jgi:hypothetical protein
MWIQDKNHALKIAQKIKDEIVGYPWDEAKYKCWITGIWYVKGLAEDYCGVLLDVRGFKHTDPVEYFPTNIPNPAFIRDKGIDGYRPFLCYTTELIACWNPEHNPGSFVIWKAEE